MEKKKVFNFLNTSCDLVNLPYEPISSNCFIVRFGVEEWLVRKVSFEPYVVCDDLSNPPANKLVIEVSQFDGCGDGWVAGHCSAFNLRGDELEVEYLDRTGVPIVRTRYEGSHVESIKFGDLDYNDDDGLRCCYITMSYSRAYDVPIVKDEKRE